MINTLRKCNNPKCVLPNKICEAKTEELHRETDECPIIVGNFTTPLSEIYRSSRWTISKDIDELDILTSIDCFIL